MSGNKKTRGAAPGFDPLGAAGIHPASTPPVKPQEQHKPKPSPKPKPAAKTTPTPERAALEAALDAAKQTQDPRMVKAIQGTIDKLDADPRERISISIPASKAEALRDLHATRPRNESLSAVVEEAIDWLLSKEAKAQGGEIPKREDSGPLPRGRRANR